jgi:hypothetical protein
MALLRKCLAELRAKHGDVSNDVYLLNACNGFHPRKMPGRVAPNPFEAGISESSLRFTNRIAMDAKPMRESPG